METYRVAEYGLNTSLDEVLSERQFLARPAEDFEPNRNWYSVQVRSKDDMDAWVQKKNEWLRLAWTPNQSPEEREANGVRMEQLQREMAALLVD